jgi:hypothetical protein
MASLTKGIDSHHSICWLPSLQLIGCHRNINQMASLTKGIDSHHSISWLPSLQLIGCVQNIKWLL